MYKKGSMTDTARKYIGVWLFIGLIMVLFQVSLGGITRLADAGLSITEWKVILGVLPPSNEAEWIEAFDKYKVAAKKQYESLHASMNLEAFKKIYFWEWFHRLWGRIMGLVFVFPYIFFLYKKWIPSRLNKRLINVVLLASLAAVFGWIMVASGLNNDNRTWVSAYKLAIHFIIATALFAYLFYTFLMVVGNKLPSFNEPILKHWIKALVVICIIQFVLGAFMAGMHAGAIHPYWPFFMGKNNLLNILTNSSLIQEQELVHYESKIWIKALVQILHRFTALLLMCISFFITIKTTLKSLVLKRAGIIMSSIMVCQFIFGVLTILNITGGKISIFYGTVHQSVALLFLASTLYLYFLVSPEKNKNFYRNLKIIS